ncbi:MAG: hypothetical protein KDB88_08535 [Flavobacteriales bacterium]|nr:hypothetical protein [Flavobacteriales bacterium]
MNVQLDFRIWPLIAGALASIFIAFDLYLVSEARQVQRNMSNELTLLDQLDALEEELGETMTLHRVALHTGQVRWDEHLDGIRERARGIASRYANEPGVDGLRPALSKALVEIDSLHVRTTYEAQDLAQERVDQAVLQLIVRRAEKQVQAASRKVHEHGLSQHSKALSQRWDEAQVLMFLSCLMAVVFALLVGMNRRLLQDSRTRGEELESARQRLESTNRDLRATMLSKEEKEVMLKEIHHRVKNNLQIVKSLIRFQMDQVEDVDTRELFNECITRVSAMALVHEQSYLSKDLANIDVNSYLDRLVRDLVHVYTIDTRLKMDIDIRVSTLGIDTLIPLGLLINEIISNAFKYAFQGREEGRITVHLAGSEGRGIHLIIGDDGVGLPSPDKWSRPDSLGMELIHTLADQLDADIRLLERQGTVYELLSRAGDHRAVA